MSGNIEITVGDVNDVEAHVFAKYVAPSGDAKRVVLSGTLRGPFCESSRTLPATFLFRPLENGETPTAEAIVPDPCIWSPELPHVYQADVKVVQGNRLISEYHEQLGLKRSHAARPSWS